MPPKPSDDPKVPITIRLRRSVKEQWDAAAARKDPPRTARVLMEEKLTEAVNPPAKKAPAKKAAAGARATDVNPRLKGQAK